MTKDEMKDEMKNRISMALKDDVLQQGFEIICKNLVELEKENAELKEKISILLSCKNCPENKGGWICEKEYEKKCLTQKVMFIKELKEEIAELNEKLEIIEKKRDYWKESSFDWRHKCTSKKSFRDAVKAQKQLTKAKEIIKDLLKCLPNENIEGIYEVTTAAEEFLRRIEE